MGLKDYFACQYATKEPIKLYLYVHLILNVDEVEKMLSYMKAKQIFRGSRAGETQPPSEQSEGSLTD